ncbi:MAG: hypothetical protein E6G97_17740 [Alphaproteobacteria bacterium]|nr:MAG: hypothetical protein E6G97_17740 [Alphaproteobacteria bacterium]
MLMYIYVASSWRNGYHEGVVQALRDQGLSVYDFRHPDENDPGFSWRDIAAEWKDWCPAEWREGLKHPIAQAGFTSDKNALDKADCVVLVLPCGRSAHLEAGYAAGLNKPVFTLALDQCEPELMVLLLGPADNLCTSLDELIARLRSITPATLAQGGS